MKPSPVRGFTLIEVMVVVSIVMLLAAMSLGSMREQRRDAEVQTEAERLAAVLRQARNRAVVERASYGVVFNIRNAADTSGVVLNNWDGGHYYQIIGPGRGRAAGNSIPVAGPESKDGGDRNFPHFLESVERSWVSERFVLGEHKVRFLALGDTDEGPRVNKDSANHADNRYYGSFGETTYPRPWFGYYDQASGVLWAWGGYDPAKDYSGFYYEGKDGDVTGSRHPVGRFYNENWNFDGAFLDTDLNLDGDKTDWGEHEVNFPIYEAGEPRALVEADYMDACIMFTPAGTAEFLEWNRGRRAYIDEQAALWGNSRAGRNGIADRAKRRKTGTSTSYSKWEYTYTDHRRVDIEDGAEVAHFVDYTGGWHITLAPDAQFDDNRFATVEEAMNSIDPCWRVFVGASGIVEVFRVQHQRTNGALGGRAVWPGSPSDWESSSLTASNPVWLRCRTGWLHEPETSAEERLLKPVDGWEPITNLLTPRMMTDKIWWIEEAAP